MCRPSCAFLYAYIYLGIQLNVKPEGSVLGESRLRRFDPVRQFSFHSSSTGTDSNSSIPNTTVYGQFKAVLVKHSTNSHWIRWALVYISLGLFVLDVKVCAYLESRLSLRRTVQAHFQDQNYRIWNAYAYARQMMIL